MSPMTSSSFTTALTSGKMHYKQKLKNAVYHLKDMLTPSLLHFISFSAYTGADFVLYTMIYRFKLIVLCMEHRHGQLLYRIRKGKDSRKEVWKELPLALNENLELKPP